MRKQYITWRVRYQPVLKRTEELLLTVVLLCPTHEHRRHVLSWQVKEIVDQKARGWTWRYGLGQIT